MSEETIKAIEVIMDGIVFKTGVATTVTTLLGWLFLSIKKTSKKINNAVTRDELDKAKDDSFRYTDDRIKIHEDKQILELDSMKNKLTDTHRMVSALYEFHLKK